MASKTFETRNDKRIAYVDLKGKTRHSSSVKRKNAFYLEFDTNQWLKTFDKTVEDFKGKGGAFERAVARITHLVGQDFLVFMNQHNFTGLTKSSLTPEPNLYWGDTKFYKTVGTTTKGQKGFTGHKVKVDKTENILFLEYGFQIDQGGLPAIFLDVGRPGVRYKNGTVSKAVKPSFFVYYAVDKNIKTFNQIFKEEVLKELGGLL